MGLVYFHLLNVATLPLPSVLVAVYAAEVGLLGLSPGPAIYMPNVLGSTASSFEVKQEISNFERRGT